MSRFQSAPLTVAAFFAGVFVTFAAIRIPTVKRWLVGDAEISSMGHGNEHSDSYAHETDHEHHDHEHSSVASIEVSESAMKNLGLTAEKLQPVALQSYQRSITIPGIVTERPGVTRIPVSAPMTGVIAQILCSPGESVAPMTPFVKMRLTHEDLITLQKEYLQSLGDLDVELKEINRLSAAIQSGAVSQKTLLDREYARDKLQATLKAQREALRLHGMAPNQLETIDHERRLLTDVTLLSPASAEESEGNVILSRNHDPSSPTTSISPLTSIRPSASVRLVGHRSTKDFAPSDAATYLTLQELKIQRGQIVNAGEVIGVFADYTNLLIEGHAFDSDLISLQKAKSSNWPLTVQIANGSSLESIGTFPIGWLDSEVDTATRTLRFYVPFQNSANSMSGGDGKSLFIDWRLRPGQRLQLSVPMEIWDEQIVLPIAAVAREGLSSYVFSQNGSEFIKTEVHEKFRDTAQVVIENDGALYPGDVVAMTGAHQLNLELKKQSESPVDPHAGHNH